VPAIPAPLRLRAFRRLAAAYTVDALGDWFGEIALSVAVLALTGRPAAVVAVWVLHRWVPGMAAPFLTVRLARRPLARTLPALYLGEAVAWTALVPVLGGGHLAVAAALVVADGFMAPVARALARTATVEVTRPAGLHREGNAVLNVIFTVSCAAGPALAGATVAGVGAELALLGNAASFLAAAVALGRNAGLPPPPDVRGSRDGDPPPRLPRDLRRLVTAAGLVVALSAAIMPVELAFVTVTLRAGEDAFGVVLAAWGIGMVAGGALAARLGRVALPVLALAGSAVVAVSYLGMGTADAIWTVVAWSAIGGAGNGISAMAFMTHVQARAGDVLQARVNGLFEMVATVGTGAGFLLGGVVQAMAGSRAVYLVAGAGILAALMWISPGPRRRSLAASTPAPLPTGP
jgi:hypothetical protein